jgi:hypothetical protein
MLAADVIEYTNQRNFIEFIKFFDTDPIQFIHGEFPHTLNFEAKLRFSVSGGRKIYQHYASVAKNPDQ